MMLRAGTPADKRAERAPETREEMMGVFQRAWSMPMRRVEAKKRSQVSESGAEIVREKWKR